MISVDQEGVQSTIKGTSSKGRQKDLEQIKRVGGVVLWRIEQWGRKGSIMWTEREGLMVAALSSQGENRKGEALVCNGAGSREETAENKHSAGGDIPLWRGSTKRVSERQMPREIEKGGTAGQGGGGVP